jgi:hypothetical protein
MSDLSSMARPETRIEHLLNVACDLFAQGWITPSNFSGLAEVDILWLHIFNCGRIYSRQSLQICWMWYRMRDVWPV